MPYFRSLRGIVPAALALSLLLVADALAVAPGHTAMAAGKDKDKPQEPSAAIEAVVCTSGFGQTASKASMSLHGVTLTDRGALAVGFSRRRDSDEGGRRAPATIVKDTGGWTRVYAGSPGEEDGLIAVSSLDGAKTWAVGFTTISGQVMPLAMRWNGKEWKTDRPRPQGSLTALFTDVAVVSDGSPLAVGYRMTGNGRRIPIAARRDGTRWRYLPVRIGRRESISFTGAAKDQGGGAWVVGHGGRGAEIGPMVFRRDGGRWQRMRMPKLKGEAVLSDVAVVSRREAWAVGYHRPGTRSLPLLLRWNGKDWKKAPAPHFRSNDVVLTAVSTSPGGGIWVVGAAWNDELGGHEAVAAWWDGQAWNEVAGRDGGTELHDVAGSLDDDGWAVGRAGDWARTTRVCIPPQSGIFGGSAPTDDFDPSPTQDLTATPDDNIDTARTDTDGAEEAVVATSLLAKGQNSKAKARAKAKAKARAKAKANAKAKARARARARARKAARAKTLLTATVDKTIEARDMTREAGLSDNTGTYGAVVADFDGDGQDDLFIGRHGRRGRLVLNRDGVFEDHEPLKLPSIDRHGCTAADIDSSGLPDLYCSLGGKRGSGLKANELWLDPGGPAPVDIAVETGVSDPTGRGRHANFLEAKNQKDVSLVVSNSPVRVDGLPSVGRLYKTTADGEFKARTSPGFAPRLGALATQDADFDGDGREDLLMVTGGAQAPQAAGTRLYRNTRRGLVDVTRQMGIRSFNEVDAELVDVNRDGKLDLVQLSENKIRVSTLKNGRFRKVWERRLTHGRAVASGDVNGDRKGDIYIVRSNGERNSADVMLVNRNGGSAWSSVVIPQVFSGSGDDAYAIDHDGNGLDDFLVLNGHNERGPVQLTAFYSR